MKSIKKLILGTIGVLALAGMIAGCGSSEKAAGTKKLVVGTEATYAPFEFAKENSDQIQGFDVDIMDAVAKRIGYTVEWKNMGFDGLIPAIKGGQINAAIAAINITPEREQVVTFSKPYYETASVVLHKKNNGISDMKELEGKTIAVQIGTAQAEEAKKIPGAKVKEFNLIPDIVNELKVGGSDAAIVDGPIAGYYTKQDSNTFAAFKTGTAAEPIAIVFNKNEKDLVEKVNKALEDMKKDGEYDKISKKWFGELNIK